MQKQSLEDMKIKYVSCRNEKEYAITIDYIKHSSENYLVGSDSYGGYLGIDLVTGEITREELDDGIPQPYTAGTATPESLQMVKEATADHDNPMVSIYDMLEKFHNEEVKPDDGTRSLPLREQKDVSDLLQALKNNGLDKEKQQLEGLINYTENMESRFDGITEELAAIREQLNQIQNNGTKSTMGMVADQAQAKVDEARKSLTGFNEGLISAAKNGVKNFKEKGKAVLKSTIEAMQIPKALEFLKTRFAKAGAEASESAAKIHMIREELYSAKEHLKNVGRAMTGSQIKEPVMPESDKGILGGIEKRYTRTQRRFERMEELTDRCIKGIEKLSPDKVKEVKQKTTRDTAPQRKPAAR